MPLSYSLHNNIKHRILNNSEICEDAKCVGICIRELCCVRDGTDTCDIFNNTEHKVTMIHRVVCNVYVS